VTLTTVCFGEPLVVLSPADDEPLGSTDHLVVSSGGAELNVAVHMARLGRPVRYAGAIGAGPLGERLRALLDVEGVDTASLVVDPIRPTGVYFREHTDSGPRVVYYRAGSAASAHTPERVAGAGEHLHLTGVTAALSPALATWCARTLQRPREYSVSFDVNYRPVLWPDGAAGEALLSLSRAADLVLVGLDEAEALWGVGTADDVRALLPDVAEVVVKDGPRTTVAFGPGGTRVTVEPEPARVTDLVGAGDAAAAGYLAGRQAGLDLTASVQVAHLLARHVIGTGSDHGVAGDTIYAAAEQRLEQPVHTATPEACAVRAQGVDHA
jgi:2-dehydro-3-deoxygluconokinase